MQLYWEELLIAEDYNHMHYHIPGRLDIYRQLMGFIKSAWRQAETIPFIALCKEPRFIREALGLNHSHCNCE